MPRTSLITTGIAITLGICLPALPASAEPADREAAEWVLKVGGRVAIAGDSKLLRFPAELPDGDFRIAAIDLLGTLVDAPDLMHIAKLRYLESLTLPGPMWNAIAGDKHDASVELGNLREIRSLRSLQLGHTYNQEINISDAGLDRLSTLGGLIELRLKSTNVTGSTLAAFPKLRRLDLTHTQTNDAGLRAISSLRELETLYLGETKITNDGLKHLSVLTKLADLELDSTSVGDSGISHLAGIQSLRRLSLLDTEVTDAGLSRLAMIDRLEDLNLYRTKVTNAGITHLARLAKLLNVDLRYTRATQSGAAALKTTLPKCRIVLSASPARTEAKPPGTPAAETVALWIQKMGGSIHGDAINLAASAVRDQDIAQLCSIKEVTRLDLSATEVGDLGIRVLAGAGCNGLSQLQEINLGNTLISDSGLEDLAKLSALQKLILNYTLVEGPGIAFLSRLPRLRHLELKGIQIGKETATLVGRLSSLETLSLGYSNLVDEAMKPLLALQRLRVLDLIGTQVSDAGIAHIRALPIEDLSLSYTNVTDASVEHLTTLPLVRLALVKTRVTDKGVTALASIRTLTHLNLDYTQVGDAGIRELKALARLTDLRLDSTDVSDTSVPIFAQLPSLKVLNLYHTLVTEAGYSKIKAALPACEIVFERDSALPNRRRG